MCGFYVRCAALLRFEVLVALDTPMPAVLFPHVLPQGLHISTLLLAAVEPTCQAGRRGHVAAMTTGCAADCWSMRTPEASTAAHWGPAAAAAYSSYWCSGPAGAAVLAALARKAEQA